MTDEELVRAAAKGSAEAFGELVRLYENKVYTLALRMCANPEDARDVAQEAFLSAWKGLPSFRGEAGFATWLYRLTITQKDYNLGSVIGIMTFIVLAVTSLLTYHRTGAYKDEGAFQ